VVGQVGKDEIRIQKVFDNLRCDDSRIRQFVRPDYVFHGISGSCSSGQNYVL
jgi:hypothetical protein